MDSSLTAPVTALLLSMLNSLLAAGVSIYTEVLFKNDKRPFLEQQIQLYFFSTLTSALLLIYCTRLGDVATQWKDMTPRSLVLLVFTIVITTGQGVALASIMQHLDSIVKYYTANIANILTAIFSAWCFPDKFSLNWSFGLSLAVLVIAIFLYEKNHLNVQISKPHI
ncbi:CMP-sialic acid transporter 1-like [Limulus polyphemus]|uniref:CMP-sialic acid transporter 1-like n=1 Tax=Limulus polyphemus TaxID=6850 RepID=A0ABM1SDT6_LIMPO|nr:CMP-sialic acid transporter 1-like [Limulus polyphemus]